MNIVFCNNKKELGVICTKQDIKCCCVCTLNYKFYQELNISNKYYIENNERVDLSLVYKIVDIINKSIIQSNTVQYEDYYLISYDTESRFAHKIFELLLDFYSLEDIERYVNCNIDSVIIYDSKEYWTYNEAVYLFAINRGYSLCIVDENEIKNELKTLDESCLSKRKEELLIQEKESYDSIVNTPRNIKPQTRIKKNITASCYAVKNSAARLVLWESRFLKQIGYNTTLISYYRTEDSEKFKKMGYEVDYLDDYYVYDEFEKAYKKALCNRSKILEYITDSLLVKMKEYDISKWIKIKLSNYYYRVLLEIIYFDVCTSNYFSLNEYRYIHVWGDTNYWETQLIYKNSRKNKSVLFRILRKDFIDIGTKQMFPNYINLLFSPDIKSTEREYGLNYDGRIVYLKEYIDYKDNAFGNGCVALLPTGLSRGLNTCFLYDGIFSRLIVDLLKTGVFLVFKYHPNCVDYWANTVIKENDKYDNFSVVDNLESAERVIDAVDVIITDMSTVAFDAICRRKAVVCIVDDLSYSFIKQHEEGIFIEFNVERAVKTIVRLINDRSYYYSIIERQNKYLEKLFTNNCNHNKRIINYCLSMEKKSE